MTTNAATGTVQSCEKLFAVVDGLRELEGAGVTELAEHIGLGKSSTHKYLKTLETNHFVVNDDGHYRLSFKFLTYGGFVRDNNDLCALAEPKAASLAAELDEMVMFSVKSHGRGIIVQIENDEHLFSDPWNVGSKFYLHELAAGKAMLAELTDEEIHDVMATVPGTPEGDEPGSITAEVGTIREREYALNLTDPDTSINAIGTAVTDPKTGEIGGMSVVGPASRLTEERLESRYADTLLGTANELQFQLQQR